MNPVMEFSADAGGIEEEGFFPLADPESVAALPGTARAVSTATSVKLERRRI